MKPKDQKYTEAVERNLFNAEPPANIRVSGDHKYRGLTIRAAKVRLGIRRADSAYDTRVAALVGDKRSAGGAA